jgi:hypothetical protein
LLSFVLRKGYITSNSPQDSDPPISPRYDNTSALQLQLQWAKDDLQALKEPVLVDRKPLLKPVLGPQNFSFAHCS